jgi:hypothetical protein
MLSRGHEISNRPGIDIFHEMRKMEPEQLAYLVHLFVPGKSDCQKMLSSQRLMQVCMAKIPIYEGEKTCEHICETTLPSILSFDSFHEIPTRHDVNIPGIEAGGSQRMNGLYYMVKLVNHAMNILARKRSQGKRSLRGHGQLFVYMVGIMCLFILQENSPLLCYCCVLHPLIHLLTERMLA